jgi:hypothetical protein
MVATKGTCIYCGRIIDLQRGQGDHVVPAALGRFDGEFIFRRICRGCNNRVGKCEEQLIRCAPEAFVRRMVKPATKRRKRGTSWVGANGMPAPKFTVRHADHQETVKVSTDDPENATLVDRLVIIDPARGECDVELSPKMTVPQLRTKLDDLGIGQFDRAFLHAYDANWEKYATLIRELRPDLSFVEAKGLEPGVHRLPGRVAFTFHVDYWRAIAKIAFHYYLLNTRRGLRGDEPVFSELRAFVMEGGDRDALFDRAGARFALPFGEVREGCAILPSTWTHILAADETQRAAVGMVTLFMGPKRLAPVYHVTLCQFESGIVVPGARFSHAYVYDAQRSGGNYAGPVVPLTLRQLR